MAPIDRFEIILKFDKGVGPIRTIHAESKKGNVMQETVLAIQTGFKDKRNSARFSCWCSLQFHHNAAWERGIATDISDTGIHIVTLHPLDTGSKVKVSFDEPGTFRNRTLMGEVKWKSVLSPFESKNWIAPSMGIEFTSQLPVDACQFARQNKSNHS